MGSVGLGPSLDSVDIPIREWQGSTSPPTKVKCVDVMLPIHTSPTSGFHERWRDRCDGMASGAPQSQNLSPTHPRVFERLRALNRLFRPGVAPAGRVSNAVDFVGGLGDRSMVRTARVGSVMRGPSLFTAPNVRSWSRRTCARWLQGKPEPLHVSEMFL